MKCDFRSLMALLLLGGLVVGAAFGGLATDDGTVSLSATFVNDAYGSKTETADTVILRVVPARVGARATVLSWAYKSGTTAHTLTFLTCMDETTVSSDAASGQAVVNVARVPTAGDGSLLAANDFAVLQHEDGTWGGYKVSSISGLAVTFTGNLTAKVLKGTKFFFHAAPGDHSDRAVSTVASTEHIFGGGDSRHVACAATKKGQPILIHSNNATAAGVLRWLGYGYD